MSGIIGPVPPWRARSSETSAVTVTISTASPAIVTWPTNHGLVQGNTVSFTTTGALPTPILPAGITGNAYYVMATGLGSATFQISATAPSKGVDGTAISTLGGTQSGTHSARAGYSAAQMLDSSIIQGAG
jgi:hypothetical protein